MSNPNNEDAQSITVLTWDSHGMIHYVDAVRGAFWASRGERSWGGTRPSTLEVVALGWNPRRLRYTITRQSLTLSAPPILSVAVGVREPEIAQLAFLKSLIGAATHGIAVLLGRKVIRESESRKYEKQPVLTFGAVQVGDLIASEFYSVSRPQGHGFASVFFDRPRERLRLALVTARAYLTYLKSLEAAQSFCSSRTMVFATEWTYIHEILSRVCETLYKTPCIYRDQSGYFFSESNLRQIPDTGLFMRPASVAPAGGRTPTDSDLTRFGLAMAGATSTPLEGLGDNGVADAKQPPTGMNSTDEKEMFAVVVFLHDVRDAQFTCGVSGYKSIQQWTTCTLSILAKRPDIEVYVKPHPNVDREPEGGPNRNFLRRLEQKFPHAFWIAPHVALDELLDEFGTSATIVTHHGTVGYEMAQRGRVALTSGLAPYRNYPMARYWQSRQEYEDILATSPANQFTWLQSPDSVSTAAERYAHDSGNRQAFTKTHQVLGRLTGNAFPEGIYADRWLETWNTTATSAEDIGLKACIEACLTVDLDKNASGGSRD